MRADNFVGSKGGAGIAQWIISQMPAHRFYVEAFLGKGVVLKTKLPASVNIGIEADTAVIGRYWTRERLCVPAPLVAFGWGRSLVCGDCLTVLPALKLDSTALVYADPPYLNRAAGNRRYYAREALTVKEHERILSTLEALPSMVMLSGYRSELYCRRLTEEKGWRMATKWTVNRAGQRVEECLWMNFAPPVFFHDTRFTGSDFTDRQRVKRKCERWRRKFLAMEPGERMAVYDALSSVVDARDHR